jgi:predicted aminopeptidase
VKKILIGILILILAYLGYHYQSLSYGLKQAYGQLSILMDAQSLERYMEENDLSENYKQKLDFIDYVKRYAVDSLGMEASDSYETIYDQKGEPILWTVTASPEFELKAYEWWFPIAGSFSYKGFFDHEAALKEKEKMEAKGFDVELDEVSAWSTLGWFNDPILSSMLERDSAKLADLIIHELFHGTVYLKDSVELNENLASFVGRKGTEHLLSSLGDTALIRQNELRRKKREELEILIKRSAEQLDSMYHGFDEDLSRESKVRKKREMIEKIRWRVATLLADRDLTKAEQYYLNFNPNNAYFTGYLTYRSKGEQFERELEEEFAGDIVKFIHHYKNL